MYNPLDDIYSEYKQKQGRGNHGVPNPVFEDEGEDFTKVRVCAKCGSFNISFDLSTNNTVCNEPGCKESTDKPNRVDFQKKMNDLKEEELNIIEQATKLGVTFTNVSQ